MAQFQRDAIIIQTLHDISLQTSRIRHQFCNDIDVRTFQRHFLESIGETPKEWLLAQRLELATLLLVQTDLPMPVVASRVGLSGADALYRLFVAQLGESPSSYRKRFSSQ